MLYQFSKDEKRNLEYLPIAISVAQIIDGHTNYLLVSKGYCELFNLDCKQALEILNTNKYKYIHEDDKFWAKQVDSNFPFQNNDSFDVVYRTKKYNDDNYFLINVNSKINNSNGIKLLYNSYSKIPTDFKGVQSIETIFKIQQIKIVEDSLIAIAIIAKKDFRLLYLKHNLHRVDKSVLKQEQMKVIIVV